MLTILRISAQCGGRCRISGSTRMADAQGVVGELKHQHGKDRARSRGTRCPRVQLLLGCSALNLRRIVAHAGKAATGPHKLTMGGAPGAPPIARL